MEQLEQIITTIFLLFIGWFYLLYRFHIALQIVDPTLAQTIGKPSFFSSAIKGHGILFGLARRRDLVHGEYASLAMMATMVRLWAYALIGAVMWLVFTYLEVTGML